MNLRLPVWLLGSLIAASATSSAFASGSYSTVRPPKNHAEGAMGMKLDHEKYGLGQKIYDGKIDLMAHEEAEMQTGRLKALQSQLPSDAMAKKDLVALAGKLTPEQLAALEYYVSQRFAMKK